MVGGKLGYLALEILEMRAPTLEIDVFAAGVVLWEALAGRRLFEGKDDLDTVKKVQACEVPPISKVNPKVPPQLDELLARAMHRDPEKRLPTAAALAAELDVLLSYLEPGVGARDIAFLVGLHVAGMSKPPGVHHDVARRLAEQLEEFAIAAASQPYVVGFPSR
jgi:serine/threonine-protein kinase